jgi:hypothetical protein
MEDWLKYAPRIEAPPAIEMPKLRFVDLSVEQIRAMPDAELLSVLSGEYDDGAILPANLQQLVATELHSRGLLAASKPHWSIVPSFWLLVVTAVLALIAAVAAILALPQIQHLLQR